MKKIFFLLLFKLMYFQSFSQCSTKQSSYNGIIIYEATYESIYKNSDLENGIQAAYLRLVVYQNAEEKDNLQFYIKVNSAKSGAKTLVVPRQISIKYSDDKELRLQAEDLGQMKAQNGFVTQEASFKISNKILQEFQTKSVSRISITDIRTNNELIGKPSSNLIKEQANCIGIKL